MEAISVIYLNHFNSQVSLERVCYELTMLSKLLNVDHINDIDWSTFGRAEVLAMTSTDSFRSKRPNSQNFTLRILKGLCHEAYLTGQMPQSNYAAIMSIRSIRGRRTSARPVPEKDEILNIMACCETDGIIGTRDAAMISAALGCGLRRTEIADLRCREIDFEQCCLRIVGKGNKERLVFFCDIVAEKLEAWNRIRGLAGGTYFFVPIHKTGRILFERHMSDETVYQIIRRRSLAAIQHPVAPHDCRRFFASQLLDESVDINTVRLAMGHSDIRTTQIYDKRDETERLKRLSAISML